MRYLPLLLLFANASLTVADETGTRLPTLVDEGFESGADRWEIMDPASWKVAKRDDTHVLSQYVKKASYKPPHRSPFHIALLKGPIVTDFNLTVRVQSTHEDYGHRDACLFFGYQDPAHFYYVHLGKQMDDHANQIFIVNESPRAKISKTTTKGTPWDDEWHTVRILREAESGKIEVYWDDQPKPIMTAVDKTFVWGRIGVGTFDDTADFDEVKLKGIVPQPPLDHLLPETDAATVPRR